VSAPDLLLACAAVPFLIAAGYLLLLTLCSARSEVPAYGTPRLFFDVIVPAHDEAANIGTTVDALLQLDYPSSLFRVIVVADNCTDATAANAARAGAAVLVRDDPDRRGKGFALEKAFAQSLADGRADALVVVDADAIPSGNLLRAFSARLEAGAPAVQSDYAILNPEASWRTRLMRIAFATFVGVRSLGRERLGLSAGLRGTGMCFAKETLRRVAPAAHSNVEDLEYSLWMGEAGLRVHYAWEAEVRCEMTTSGRAAAVQRGRWEGGRRRLAHAQGPRLLWKALASRSPLLLDLAFDLVVPPLAQLASLVALGCVLSAALAVQQRALGLSLVAWGACASGLAAYCFRGWVLSRTGARGLVDLAHAPLYIAWKVFTLLRGSGSGDAWIRTAREKKAGSG
jgi:hypothetical protein